MKNNKKLYLYLQDRAEWMIERWTKACGIETPADFSIPTTLKDVKRLYQIFIMDISKIFLVEQGLFLSYLNDWMNEITEEAVRRNMDMSEIPKQFKKLRAILWECVGEFVEMHPQKVAHKEILLWSELIDLAFDQISEAFTVEYERIKKEDSQNIYKKRNQLLATIIPVSSEKSLIPIIGELNKKSAKELTAYSLHHCTRTGTKRVYLDLSGLSMSGLEPDGNNLLYMISALKGAGLEVILSGVHSDQAQKLVQYNHAFHKTEWYSSLEEALKS